MSLILSGGLVATMDGQRTVLSEGSVVVQDRTIVDVSERVYRGGNNDTVLDCRNKVVLPGLVNAHAHTVEPLFRGCATDLPFLRWLFERNHPLLKLMTGDDAYAAGLLFGLELLSCGTTCYLDPEVWPEHFDAVARAMQRVGLRASLALAMEGGTGYSAESGHQLEGSGPEADLERVHHWHGAAGGRLRVWLGPRVLSAIDFGLGSLLRQTATSWNTGITVHFAEIPEDVRQIRQEHGVLPTAYLESMGLMGPDMVLVHGICLEPSDIDCMARTGTSLAHCPAANLKLGNGFAPVPDLLAAGVVVGLGTDGGLCNDSCDILREMALAGLIHKGYRRDPLAVSAEQVMAMVTCDGARALGLQDQVGSLEAGKLADISVLDMDGVGWRPLHNPFANLVYGSASRASVNTVIVDGEVLVWGGVVQHLDGESILREAQERSEALVLSAGLSAAVRSPWQPLPGASHVS